MAKYEHSQFVFSCCECQAEEWFAGEDYDDAFAEAQYRGWGYDCPGEYRCNPCRHLKYIRDRIERMRSRQIKATKSEDCRQISPDEDQS